MYVCVCVYVCDYECTQECNSLFKDDCAARKETPVTLILLTLASETSTDRNVPSRMRKKTHYVSNCIYI